MILGAQPARAEEAWCLRPLPIKPSARVAACGHIVTGQGGCIEVDAGATRDGTCFDPLGCRRGTGTIRWGPGVYEGNLNGDGQPNGRGCLWSWTNPIGFLEGHFVRGVPKGAMTAGYKFELRGQPGHFVLFWNGPWEGRGAWTLEWKESATLRSIKLGDGPFSERPRNYLDAAKRLAAPEPRETRRPAASAGPAPTPVPARSLTPAPLALPAGTPAGQAAAIERAHAAYAAALLAAAGPRERGRALDAYAMAAGKLGLELVRPQLVRLFEQDFPSGFEAVMQTSLPFPDVQRMVPPRFERCMRERGRWAADFRRGLEPTCSVR